MLFWSLILRLNIKKLVIIIVHVMNSSKNNINILVTNNNQKEGKWQMYCNFSFALNMYKKYQNTFFLKEVHFYNYVDANFKMQGKNGTWPTIFKFKPCSHDRGLSPYSLKASYCHHHLSIQTPKKLNNICRSWNFQTCVFRRLQLTIKCISEASKLLTQNKRSEFT